MQATLKALKAEVEKEPICPERVIALAETIKALYPLRNEVEVTADGKRISASDLDKCTRKAVLAGSNTEQPSPSKTLVDGKVIFQRENHD